MMDILVEILESLYQRYLCQVSPVCIAQLLPGNLAREDPMMTDLNRHKVTYIVDLEFQLKMRHQRQSTANLSCQISIQNV